MFQTPILVIAYHRVESTHDVFEALRQLKPEKLYVAADGAISNDRTDYQHCLKARCVFVPEWKCEMKTLFKDTHQGKSKMFMQAMQWFFEQEEEGIVLFDDTVPTLDFFHFCRQMLETYRSDRRIGHISGSYLLKHNRLDEGSYYFSAYPLTWGFATWRDRFENFDLKMKELENVVFRTLTDKYLMKKKHANFWQRRFRILQKNQVDIWEYQYIFHLWNQGALTVVPNVNLVENRGFLTKRRRIRKLNRPLGTIHPIRQNTKVEQDADADKYVFRRYFKKDFRTILANWVKENLLGEEKTV